MTGSSPELAGAAHANAMEVVEAILALTPVGALGTERAAMVIESFAEAVLTEVCAVTEKPNVPAAVGTPEMRPETESVSPGGKAPEDTVYEPVAVPCCMYWNE